MNLKRTNTTGIALLTIAVCLQAQNTTLSIGDDRKKLLLEQVKPPVNSMNELKYDKESLRLYIDKNDIPGVYKNLKAGTGGEEFEDKYKISPHLKKFTKEQIFNVKKGQKLKVLIIDGKFTTVPIKDYEDRLDQMSQRNRLQGIMVSSGMGGLNLSGYQKKKMSTKSKSILQHVFGMEVED